MAAPKKSGSTTRSTSQSRSRAQANRPKSSRARAARTAPGATGALKKAAKPRMTPPPRIDENHCASCSLDLRKGDRALFVEEEVGRVFCSEECISTYFAPEIDALERDLERHRQKGRDLSDEARDSFSHLRWVTLEQPDEIWRNRMPSGDWKYTLISEFQPGDKRVWCICQTLFLKGEPSFLFLAVPTQDPVLVARYRKGEQVTISRTPSRKDEATGTAGEGEEADGEAGEAEMAPVDGLADGWTDEETIRARIRRMRTSKDIPESQFEDYEAAVGQTLEAPDEVWSSALVSLPGETDLEESEEDGESRAELEASGQNPRLYHFIKAYADEKPGYWYVIIARDTPEEGQIEILDSFPTNDIKVVESLRVGTLEYGENELPAYSRLVH
jgi:hypothetical protein